MVKNSRGGRARWKWNEPSPDLRAGRGESRTLQSAETIAAGNKKGRFEAALQTTFEIFKTTSRTYPTKTTSTTHLTGKTWSRGLVQTPCSELTPQAVNRVEDRFRPPREANLVVQLLAGKSASGVPVLREDEASEKVVEIRIVSIDGMIS